MKSTVLIIVLCFLLLSLWGFYSAIRPWRIISTVTPENFGIPFQNISFRTKDNIELKGWYISASKPTKKTIILLHGYPADKGNILPVMIFLHNEYNLFLFDFRYFGASEGSYTTLGKDEVLDLLAAIDYLHARGIKKVGIWGFSFGGAVALLTAPHTSAIKAIVAEAPFARLDWMAYEYYNIPFLRYPLGVLTRFWGLMFFQKDISKISPAEAAKKLTIPILLIHSKQDNVISFKHAVLLQNALVPNKKSEVIFIEDKRHGEFIDNHQKVISQFFEKNL